MVRDEYLLDNTLPQSAYAHVTGAEEGAVDPNRKDCFRRFANAYVYAKTRRSILAESELGFGDPFIELWHENATCITDADRRIEAADQDRLIDTFCRITSGESEQTEWSGLARYHCTPAVAERYRLRFSQWRDKCASAIQTVVIPTTSPILLRQPMRNLADRIDREINPACFDAVYRDEARRLSVSCGQYALAEAFVWFARGQAYAAKTIDIQTQFHPLRTSIVCTAEIVNMSEMHPKTVADINWGTILEKQLEAGGIRREKSEICNILRSLNDTNFRDKNFCEYVSVFKDGDSGPAERVAAKRNAVMRALLKAGVPPGWRNQNAIDRFLGKLEDEAKRLAEEKNVGIANRVFHFGCQVLHVAVSRKQTRLLVAKALNQLNPEYPWKCFKVAGMVD